MKKYSLLIIILVTTFTANAQFFDDIESYDEGIIFTDRWRTWTNENDGIQNAIVTTDMAFSGNKSIFVGPGENGQDPLLVLQPAGQAGKWNITWKMYIPSGNSGYFNLQGDVFPSASENNQFITGNVNFNEENASPGQGVDNNPDYDEPATFTFPHDEWFTVAAEVEPDIFRYRLVINEQELGYAFYASGGFSFGGVNFFASDDANTFYIDDINYQQGTLSTETEAPIASCIETLTIELNEAGFVQITAQDIDNGSSDNSGAIALSINQEFFNCLDLGENIITLTVKDASGNTSTCETIVTVIDPIGPVASCTEPINIQLDSFGFASILPSDINSNSSDNCQSPSLELDITEFSCDDIGENTVTLTITDSFGNSSTCFAIVNVEPYFSCPSFIIQNLEDNQCVVNDLDLGTFLFLDDCLPVNTITNDAPDIFTVGVTEVNWTITFTDNNTYSCIQTVIINDTQTPEITCIENQTVQIETGELYTIPDYYAIGDILVSDNCAIQSIIQSPLPNQQVSEGIQTITVTVEDVNSNFNTCSFELNVETILGIQSQNDFSINVFPSPVKDILNINIGTESINVHNVKLYSLSGNLITTKTVSTSESFIMDLSYLPASLYFLSIETDSGFTVKNIIKL